MLKIASENGRFILTFEAASGKGGRLKPDDLAIWLPLKRIGTVPPGTDPRCGWMGLVVAKVKPEIDTSKPDFGPTCHYA